MATKKNPIGPDGAWTEEQRAEAAYNQRPPDPNDPSTWAPGVRFNPERGIWQLWTMDPTATQEAEYLGMPTPAEYGPGEGPGSWEEARFGGGMPGWMKAFLAVGGGSLAAGTLLPLLGAGGGGAAAGSGAAGGGQAAVTAPVAAAGSTSATIPAAITPTAATTGGGAAATGAKVASGASKFFNSNAGLALLGGGLNLAGSLIGGEDPLPRKSFADVPKNDPRKRWVDPVQGMYENRKGANLGAEAFLRAPSWEPLHQPTRPRTPGVPQAGDRPNYEPLLQFLTSQRQKNG